MEKTIDLFLFMGQSNMAGRGICSEKWPEPAPQLTPGAGYEFRAISDPTKLYPAAEPFGVKENNLQGIHEDRKTGSLVTAFINAYYAAAGVPVVGVSASKGGSSIGEWQPGGAYLNDTIGRMKTAEAFLSREGWTIRHRYMLWCQGETDGDLGLSGADYKAAFKRMFSVMRQQGIERCFLIKIGHYNGDGPNDYRLIMKAQEELAREEEHVVLVSRSFETMKARGLMKDEFHYFQTAYNEVGTEAGTAAGQYVKHM